MAKKVKNPEMLVAEIHTQQSKLASLKAQLAANEGKIQRLSSTNSNIRAKGQRLEEQLKRNMTLAQQNGLKF
jgi:septal ring factor EnvC (AmiA/AmiB activator)